MNVSISSKNILPVDDKIKVISCLKKSESVWNWQRSVTYEFYDYKLRNLNETINFSWIQLIKWSLQTMKSAEDIQLES